MIIDRCLIFFALLLLSPINNRQIFAADVAPTRDPARETLWWHAEVADIQDAMRRTSTGLRLDLPLMTVRIASHDIVSTPFYSELHLGLTEAAIGSDWDFANNLRVMLNAGFFSAGTGEFTGEVHARYRTTQGGRFEAGVFRRPLALLVPLEREDSDVMRQALFVDVGFGQFMDARWEYRQEDSLSRHDDLRGVFRVPLLRKKDGSHEGDFRIELSTAFHSRPSPFYASPLRVTTGSAGYEWRGVILSDVDGARWRGGFLGQYGIAFVSPRDRGTAEQVSFWDVSGNADWQVESHLMVRGRLIFATAREDVNENIHRRKVSLGVDIKWDI
jgi:hypothetical protein